MNTGGGLSIDEGDQEGIDQVYGVGETIEVLENGILQDLRPPADLAHGTGHNCPANGQTEGQSAKNNQRNGTEMRFITGVTQEDANENRHDGNVPVEVFLQSAQTEDTCSSWYLDLRT